MTKWWEQYKRLSLTQFLETLDHENWVWVAKRLSGNDTGLTGGHQSGLYLPRWYFERAFPEVAIRTAYNPRIDVQSYFPDFDTHVENAQAIYYNSKYFPEKGKKKKYDEFRLTGWGGRSNPIQDPENTGALLVFAVKEIQGIKAALVWICSSEIEDTLVESWLGTEALPGEIYGPQHLLGSILDIPKALQILANNIIEAMRGKWERKFPSGEEIFKAVASVLPYESWKKTVDELLIRRRAIEFSVFQEIEKTHVLPLILKGFPTVNDFLDVALTVANRRKSRTGRSLELNLSDIFVKSGLQFEEQAKTERNKKPDFLFPSGDAYKNPAYPATKLHMLAAKTCCKDRWRQIIDEADRITEKHLFTLQEGVSEDQFRQMRDNDVVLVVPAPNIVSFPKVVQKDILCLQSFVNFIYDEQNSGHI